MPLQLVLYILGLRNFVAKLNSGIKFQFHWRPFMLWLVCLPETVCGYIW